MPEDNADTATPQLSKRERFHNTLVERAQGISSVRTDIYTVKYWQFALNIILGVGAIALLVAGMIKSEFAYTVWLVIAGVVCGIALIVFNLTLKTRSPISYLQYTVIQKDKRYCFQVMPKERAVFSDGENVVETSRAGNSRREHIYNPQYCFDFFTELDVDMRIGKADTETFVGKINIDGKLVKSKIVFKNGVLYRGVVGGARIKYFDIDNTKEKFVVPSVLRDAAEKFEVPFPKLNGLYVRDPRTSSPYRLEN